MKTPSASSLSVALVLMVPALALVVLTWKWGFIYTFDESDSFGSFMQAYNLLHFDPLKTYLLADDTFLPRAQPESPNVYVNNPTLLPRLASALLQAVGFDHFIYQNAFLCIVLYGASVGLLYLLFRGQPSPLIVFAAIAFAFDYFGTFRGIANAGGAWYYVLLLFCLYSLFGQPRRRSAAIFGAFALLWLFMLHYAVFVVLACLFTYLLLYPGQWRRLAQDAAAVALGSAVSLSIFVLQLRLYLGSFQGILNRFFAVMNERSGGHTSYSMSHFADAPLSFADLVALYDRSDRIWHLPTTLWQLLRDTAASLVSVYGTPLCLLMALGFVTAVYAALTPGQRKQEAIPGAECLLTAVLLASVAAYVVTAIVFRGQIYLLHVYHFHPLLFPITALSTAFGVGALVRLARSLDWPEHETGVVAALALASLCLTSSMSALRKYPTLDGEGFLALYDRQFRGAQFAMQLPYGEMVWNATGVPPYYVSDLVAPAPEDRAKVDTSDFGFCIDHWSAGKSRPPKWPVRTCREVRERLDLQGYSVVMQGQSYAVISLKKAVLAR